MIAELRGGMGVAYHMHLAHVVTIFNRTVQCIVPHNNYADVHSY